MLVHLALIGIGTMSQANYGAKSDLVDVKAVGGFGESANASWSMFEVNLQAKSLSLVYIKNACCGTGANDCPMKIVLANGSAEDVWLRAADGRLNLAREAQDSSGKWRNIEFRPPVDCGNSFHSVALTVGRAWAWDVPTTTGTLRTKTRYVLHGLAKPIYSPDLQAQIKESDFDLPVQWSTYVLLPDGSLNFKR